ncbi:unnamed protein product, partial [marine sediment metagenome]
KYSRSWLSKKTGYSKGYLCRVATGKTRLSKYFIVRVAFSLREHPSELFLPEALKDNFRREHREKRRSPSDENLVSGA